ncbi:MAG: SPOR domain-containing protein [Bacteroidales bacterium]|nr:SPOR domain-containing protein [Bacteroidales bacterium]
MISIAEAISDLLFARDTVVVPGLGAFVKKPVSAQVNPVANYFAMPSSELVFEANLREDNDLVINYIAEKNEVPEDEARRVLAMFVSDCFNSLKQGKKVVLNNIGTLSNDWAGDLVFEQDKTVNYNADAFGLCDFTPEPVLRSKTKDEIKAEIEQQQKDKNTPVTVDEKAVHEHDKDDQDEPFDDDRRGLGWLWVLLGLLLLAGVGYGLHYFKVVDYGRWFGNDKPAEYVPWTVVLPETNTWKTEVVVPQEQQEDTLAVPQQPVEVVQEPELEPKQVQQTEPVVASPDANIRIIAGCFDQEENAIRLVNSLKSKGYQGAFYELRNTRWFVSFGRYANDEEATTALREIRTNTEYKAWILK